VAQAEAAGLEVEAQAEALREDHRRGERQERARRGPTWSSYSLLRIRESSFSLGFGCTACSAVVFTANVNV
jgi:hypothetical protein